MSAFEMWFETAENYSSDTLCGGVSSSFKHSACRCKAEVAFLAGMHYGAGLARTCDAVHPAIAGLCCGNSIAERIEKGASR